MTAKARAEASRSHDAHGVATAAEDTVQESSTSGRHVAAAGVDIAAVLSWSTIAAYAPVPRQPST